MGRTDLRRMAGVWSLRIPGYSRPLLVLVHRSRDRRAMIARSPSVVQVLASVASCWTTSANCSKSARFAVLSGCCFEERHDRRPRDPLAASRRSEGADADGCRAGCCSMIARTRRTRRAASSTGLDGACLGRPENSCWTCQPRPTTCGLRTDRDRRSNLRRRRSRRPTARATSAFPADCPHRSDCHCSCHTPTEGV